MESAAFLLDSRLRLVQINGPAEELLRQGEIISRGNTIELSNRHDHARFRDLLANVSQKRAAEHSSSGGRLSFFCSKPEPHTAHALVAPVMVKFIHQESAMHILVLIKTVRKDTKSLPAVLNHLWGCTEAEAAVTIMLMGDHTPHEIANVRKVSVGTVRNQIKSLLSKTNTRRQSQFVHLLFQLPSEIRPPVCQMGQAFHANPGDSHF
jgi:DNA-binding CsgD family transcriptional regulator